MNTGKDHSDYGLLHFSITWSIHISADGGGTLDGNGLM
jgi:hypothetical protein